MVLDIEPVILDPADVEGDVDVDVEPVGDALVLLEIVADGVVVTVRVMDVVAEVDAVSDADKVGGSDVDGVRETDIVKVTVFVMDDDVVNDRVVVTVGDEVTV